MKTFLIRESNLEILKNKTFSIDSAYIKTMHYLPELSSKKMRVKMFNGVDLLMSNGDLTIKAKLLHST